jgi:glycosyltransferase involved in cell wall biosynthesis
MARADVVYLYVWSGDAQRARALAASHYPGVEMLEFPHRRLRDSTPAGRVRLLRGLRGRAIVFYFQSLADLRYRQMLACMHFLHHCDETVLCDGGGQWQPSGSAALLRAMPSLLWSMLCDLKTLIFCSLYLRLGFRHAVPVPFSTASRQPQVAYLIPSPVNMGASGGAISHIRGFLRGVQKSGKSCRVFTSTPLAQESFANEVIAAANRRYFFWQAVSLAHNFTFAAGVQRRLGACVPAIFYQRHTRFCIAGALLSKRMGVPLIVEYNAPETWVAEHWDPTPFRSLIALCEEVTLRSAARIVVVSEALRAGLLRRGFGAERIVVNPNGVDGDYFSPGRGRATGRAALHVQPEEILIGFVGSFSLWHGIEILQQAIAELLSDRQAYRLRFVLIGEGLLQGEMRSALAAYERTGEVIFTNSLPPAKVAEYLDAADILVSPHIPMPDGSRFFGSPTKLFEYMAMGKAIVASRLEQLAEVLTHGETAWLVSPGSVQELSAAIRQLAGDPALRAALGSAARRSALQNHSWDRNVAVALRDEPRSAQDSVDGMASRLLSANVPNAQKLSRAAGNTG